MARVHRRWYERVLRVLRRTTRYRCKNEACAYEALFYGSVNSWTFGAVAWVFAIALALGTATCATYLAERLARPKGEPSESEEFTGQ
jgi:hypothetical protein